MIKETTREEIKEETHELQDEEQEELEEEDVEEEDSKLVHPSLMTSRVSCVATPIKTLPYVMFLDLRVL